VREEPSIRVWRLPVVIVSVCLMLTPGAMAEAADEESVRLFEGQGSQGIESPVELYLLEATYQHRVEADAGCVLTAGVFPAPRAPAVLVSEVLQADLAVGMSGRAGPSGEFGITQPGWATVQIGTGPECHWAYEISGRFLPPGREPRPPGVLDQPWILWLSVAVGGILVIGTLRRRTSANEIDSDEQPKITVVDA
jgi:hypothetical protein